MTTSTRRHTRTRKDPDVRLEEIIQAATKLFGERGFWATSLQDVADECDFTVTGILYHVGSKEGLMQAVLDAMDQRLFAACAHEMDRDGVTFELGRGVPGITIGQLFRILVRVTVMDPEAAYLYSVMENESTDPGHPAHAYFRVREQAALESYASTVPEGNGDPMGVARMAMGLLSGLHVQWLRDPHGVDMVALWEEIVEEIPVLADRTPVGPRPVDVDGGPGVEGREEPGVVREAGGGGDDE